MDAIDILGSLLGGKSSGGLGGKILKDMMGRSAPSPAPKQQPSPIHVFLPEAAVEPPAVRVLEDR